MRVITQDLVNCYHCAIRLLKSAVGVATFSQLFAGVLSFSRMTDVRFGAKVGQIGNIFDTPGTSPHSLHICSIVPFGANLTHFEPKSDTLC